MEVTLVSLEGDRFVGIYEGADFDIFEKAVVEKEPVQVEFDTIGMRSVVVDGVRRLQWVQSIDGSIVYVILEVCGEIVDGAMCYDRES